MQPADIDVVVETHLASFQHFFLSSLGSCFLRELYSGIVADSSGIAIVAEKVGQVQGFVAGTDNPRGFYKRLLRRRWWRFTLASIKPAITKPKNMPRLLRAFSRDKQQDVHENCSMLMSIAVIPSSQGQGIGKLLIHAFVNEAGRRGTDRVNLTTDKFDNEMVNSFYQDLGFRLRSTYITPEGRTMNEYIFDIHPSRHFRLAEQSNQIV